MIYGISVSKSCIPLSICLIIAHWDMFYRHSKNVYRYLDPGGEWLYSIGVFFGGLPVVTRARLLENSFVFSIL